MGIYIITAESQSGGRYGQYFLNTDEQIFKRLDYIPYNENIYIDSIYFTCQSYDGSSIVNETYMFCQGKPTEILNTLITEFTGSLLDSTPIFRNLGKKDASETVTIAFKHPRLFNRIEEEESMIELEVLRSCVQPILNNLFGLKENELEFITVADAVVND